MKKWVLLAALALVGGAAAWGSRTSTPAITDSQGRPAAGSIASLETVAIGGWPQHILVRGRQASNPVLLFLHGGPGMPAMYLAHAFQRPLEERFVVVQWDQRGAGKSYRRDVPVASMTYEQIIADARELIDLLRARFGVQKVYLVAHSWGTSVGMRLVARYPERVQAYVGVGQVVDRRRSREIVNRFIRDEATRRGRPEAIEDLEARGDLAHEKWVFQFGGELAGATSWTPLLMTGLRAPEYSFYDVLRVKWGVDFSHAHMKDAPGELIDEVTEVKVPVYFFEGRRDYTTPAELAEVYLQRLRAPSAKVVWFEHSAHFPFLEEPDRFAQQMAQVLAETRDAAIQPAATRPLR
jgi:pimeloyl-ACP methyl ester carboxylesterase